MNTNSNSYDYLRAMENGFQSDNNIGMLLPPGEPGNDDQEPGITLTQEQQQLNASLSSMLDPSIIGLDSAMNGALASLRQETMADGIDWDAGSDANDEDLGLLFWDEVAPSDTAEDNGGDQTGLSNNIDPAPAASTRLGEVQAARQGHVVFGGSMVQQAANSTSNLLEQSRAFRQTASHQQVQSSVPQSAYEAPSTHVLQTAVAQQPAAPLFNQMNLRGTECSEAAAASNANALLAATPLQQQLNALQQIQAAQAGIGMAAAGQHSQINVANQHRSAGVLSPPTTVNCAPVSLAGGTSVAPGSTVMTQQPNLSVHPAGHPYYTALLLQQQAQMSQVQVPQVAAMGGGTTPQSLAINHLQILQALQQQQPLQQLQTQQLGAFNPLTLQQQGQVPIVNMPGAPIQPAQAMLQNSPPSTAVANLSVPPHLQLLYQAQQDAIKMANENSKAAPGSTPSTAMNRRAGTTANAEQAGVKRRASESGVLTAPVNAGVMQHPGMNAGVPQAGVVPQNTIPQPFHGQMAQVMAAPYSVAGQPQQQAMFNPLISSLAMPIAATVVSASDTSVTTHPKKRSRKATKAAMTAKLPIDSISAESCFEFEDSSVALTVTKPGTTIHRPLSEEERKTYNRERNREHAKNTRIRKKQYVERLKVSVDELCCERDSLVTERSSKANRLLDTHSKRVDVLRSFFALRASYTVDQKRELWSGILDESSFTCRVPVTPYQSFPSSEVQVSNCQRTVVGVDAMIADSASNYVFLDSLVDRAKYPNAQINFQYTLITEEAVVSGTQLMARWSMSTLNAKKCGANHELNQIGMLICKFNSAHKIISIELMFDVMAFTLQVRVAMGYDNFNDIVIPNTVQTSARKEYDYPMVMTKANRPYSIVSVNERWEKLTGFKSGEVVGRSCSILQGFDTTRKELNQLMAPTLYKRPSCAMVTNYTKSGRKFRHYVTIYPLSTDSNISHFFGITTFVEFLDESAQHSNKNKSLSCLTSLTSSGLRGESGARSNGVVA